MKHVELFTDGACSGNPGPGGWGAILRYQGVEKELSGGEANTTNNRMELSAAIEGLAALKESCHVTLTSDSKYLTDGVTKGWARSWKRNGWRTADKKPVKNVELWQRLDALASRFEIEWRWVKGHNGDPGNEKADELANLGVEVALGKRPAPTF